LLLFAALGARGRDFLAAFAGALRADFFAVLLSGDADVEATALRAVFFADDRVFLDAEDIVKLAPHQSM